MRSVFLGLALTFLFLWAVAFVVFRVAGFLVHVLLLLAVIFFIMRLATSARTS
jgi:Family of unknown function (DUF5670)